MEEKTLKEIIEKIRKYLQNDCSDEWHVELTDNHIVGYYTNIKEFTLTYDDGYLEWYISGEYMNVGMTVEICKILQEYKN